MPKKQVSHKKKMQEERQLIVTRVLKKLNINVRLQKPFSSLLEYRRKKTKLELRYFNLVISMWVHYIKCMVMEMHYCLSMFFSYSFVVIVD